MADHDAFDTDFFTDNPYRTTKVPKNHGNPWTTKDDKRLVALLKTDETIADIAEFFGRSEHSIMCRIEFLATAHERAERLARNIAILRGTLK